MKNDGARHGAGACARAGAGVGARVGIAAGEAGAGVSRGTTHRVPRSPLGARTPPPLEWVARPKARDNNDKDEELL